MIINKARETHGWLGQALARLDTRFPIILIGDLIGDRGYVDAIKTALPFTVWLLWGEAELSTSAWDEHNPQGWQQGHHADLVIVDYETHRDQVGLLREWSTLMLLRSRNRRDEREIFLTLGPSLELKRFGDTSYYIYRGGNR